MSQRILLPTLALLFVGTIVLGVVSWREAWSQTHPTRQAVGRPPTHFLGTLATVSFQTDDGIRLEGWYAPAPNGQTAVVLLHPYGANRLAMLSRAALYHQAGLGVLLYDARASGNSSGAINSVGYYEARDLLAALSWLRAHGVRDIVCHGWSQGGATILMAAEQLGDVRGVVLEAAFDTMEHVIDRAFRHRVHLPGAIAGIFYTPMLEHLLGFDVDQFRPIDHAPSLRCPTLIVAGTADHSTWEVDTQQIVRAVHAPTKLWLIPKAEHQDLYDFAPDYYRRDVLGFVLHALAAKSSTHTESATRFE